MHGEINVLSFIRHSSHDNFIVRSTRVARKVLVFTGALRPAARNLGRRRYASDSQAPNVWSVIRVFLFDAIYGRVKRLTKRMTSRSHESLGRISRLYGTPSELRLRVRARTKRIKALAGQIETDRGARTTIYERNEHHTRPIV